MDVLTSRTRKRNQSASIWCVLWGCWSKFQLWFPEFAFSKRITQICTYYSESKPKQIAVQKIWNYWLKNSHRATEKLPGLPSFYLKKWLSQVNTIYTVTFLYKKCVKQKYIQTRILKWMSLLAELERGMKTLQFDMCCKATDQNHNCGCHLYAILRLDSLLAI